MNFKVTLQYDGTDFHGWQIQPGLRTVQGELTQALSLVDSREVVVHGSGRTDAGVHAEGQVASVNLERKISAAKLRAAINGNVGKDLRAIEVVEVADDFHARYSAIEKTYCYRVVTGPVISPFWLRYAGHEGRTLDLSLMRECVSAFLGTHEWSAFSSAQSDAENKVRTITALSIDETWEERGRCHMLVLRATADGFLRYMVRAIVGTLLAVGRKELDAAVVKRAIESGDRSLSGATAPAQGLTLVSVRYDDALSNTVIDSHGA